MIAVKVIFRCPQKESLCIVQAGRVWCLCARRRRWICTAGRRTKRKTGCVCESIAGTIFRDAAWREREESLDCAPGLGVQGPWLNAGSFVSRLWSSSMLRLVLPVGTMPSLRCLGLPWSRYGIVVRKHVSHLKGNDTNPPAEGAHQAYAQGQWFKPRARYPLRSNAGGHRCSYKPTPK